MEAWSAEMLHPARAGKTMLSSAPVLKETVAKLHLGSRCQHSKRVTEWEKQERQRTSVQLKNIDFLNEAYFNLKKHNKLETLRRWKSTRCPATQDGTDP